jgi:hypothetical protein
VDWRLERQECNVESVPSGQKDPQSQGTRITHVLRAVCAYRVFTYNALCVANLYTFTRPCTHSLSHFLTRTLTFFQPELTHSLSHTHIYMLTLSHSQVADDGLFWMAFEDYVRHYDGMCISYMYAMRYTFIHYIYTLPLHTTRMTTTHYTPPLAHTHTRTPSQAPPSRSSPTEDPAASARRRWCGTNRPRCACVYLRGWICE